VTDDIDRALRMLGEAELPARYDDLGRSVMARIDAVTRAREARPSFGVGFGPATVAVITGIATVNIRPASEQMPLELSVFSANAAFAPSTLLATEE